MSAPAVCAAMQREIEEQQQTIEQLQARIEQLEALLAHDELTGALTRTWFERDIDRRVQRWDRPDFNEVVGILFLDANRFKEVNDTYGHAEGDKVLRKLAQTLLEIMRPEDLVVRYGGDEFLIIVTVEDAQIIKKICGRILANAFVENDRYSVDFSIGAVKYHAGEGIVSAIKRADEYMYRAKRSEKCPLVMNLD